jgi:hypothetical protein
LTDILILIVGGPSKQQLLLYVEERAKKILVVDEYNSIINHIKQVCLCQQSYAIRFVKKIAKT